MSYPNIRGEYASGVQNYAAQTSNSRDLFESKENSSYCDVPLCRETRRPIMIDQSKTGQPIRKLPGTPFQELRFDRGKGLSEKLTRPSDEKRF
jgi:hypothetical protein